MMLAWSDKNSKNSKNYLYGIFFIGPYIIVVIAELKGKL